MVVTVARASVVVVVGISLSLPGWAKTYYVDRDGQRAADTNVGTSPSSAWKHCPGLKGWAGSVTLQPGDIVYFDSSDTWTAGGGAAMLSIKGGVTYDGSTWGSGTRATLRATSSFSSAVIYVKDDHPTEATTVRGFEVDGANKGVTGIGVNWPNTGKSLVGATKRVENCLVHHMGIAAAKYGIKVGVNGGRKTADVEISDCTVHDTPRTAIVVYPGMDNANNQVENITIAGCEAYNSGLSNTVTPHSTAGHGISLKNHSIDVVVEHNYLHDTDGRGIGMSAGYSSGVSGGRGTENAIVRHNIMRDCGKGGVYVANSGARSFSIYGNLIFNNLAKGSGGAGIFFESNLGGQISAKIYNNTLYHNGNGEVLIASSAASFKVLELKNNIMHALSGKIPYRDVQGGKATTSSHNIYFRDSEGTLVNDGGKTFTPTSIADWEATGRFVDPLFHDVASLPAGFTPGRVPETDGLNLQVGSPARNHGETLDSAFNTSVNGVARPVGAAWDIGAYEYSPTALPQDASQVDGESDTNEPDTSDSQAEDVAVSDEHADPVGPGQEERPARGSMGGKLESPGCDLAAGSSGIPKMVLVLVLVVLWRLRRLPRRR